MSANKSEPPTKTIAFRWPSNVVDKIKEAAVDKKISMQDYFLTQISPGSDLMRFIVEEQEKMLTESKAVIDARDAMVNEAKRLMEQAGLSEDAFLDAAKQALTLIVKGSNKA